MDTKLNKLINIVDELTELVKTFTMNKNNEQIQQRKKEQLIIQELNITNAKQIKIKSLIFDKINFKITENSNLVQQINQANLKMQEINQERVNKICKNKSPVRRRNKRCGKYEW